MYYDVKQVEKLENGYKIHFVADFLIYWYKYFIARCLYKEN